MPTKTETCRQMADDATQALTAQATEWCAIGSICGMRGPARRA